MWDAFANAAKQTLEAGLRAAEDRRFVASLFSGTQEEAVGRLRERVRSLDRARFAEFRTCLESMAQEAAAHLEQVRAQGDASWGTSFEDRIAQFMAERGSGGGGSSQAVREAEGVVAGLQAAMHLADQFHAEASSPRVAAAPAPAAVAARAPSADPPAPPSPPPAGPDAIDAMLDQFVESGTMPEGLLERLAQIDDPARMDRVMAKLKALGADELGAAPPLEIAAHYEESDEPLDLLWPLAAKLPLPFDELDRKTRFHVLWGELSRRLLEASAARNAGRLDESEAAFRECAERAEQLGVHALKAQAWDGLMTLAERRGARDDAKRYLRLAALAQARQKAHDARRGGGPAGVSKAAPRA